MTIDTTRLRALAEKATPGPWDGEYKYGIMTADRSRNIVSWDYAWGDSANECDDKPFIAACSPDVILALLDEVERLRKIFDDAGQGEHNVLALVEHYQECAAESDERAALAYPRALQAAADVVLNADMGILDVDDAEALAWLDDLANDITDLSAEQIERIAKEHEHE